MMWKIDPAVEALRKQAGWREFHRCCGDHGFFFDHIERDGKRGPYRVVAFELEKRRSCYVNVVLAEGAGKGPLEALADAYRKVERPVAEAELNQLLGVAPAADDFEDILGGDAADDMEDLLG